MPGLKEVGMAVSAYEQETVINFNKEEKLAYIFTYEKTWQRHLEKKLGLKPLHDNGRGGKEYQIDKRRISMPRALRKLSVEHKKKLVDALNRNRILRRENATVYRNQTKEKLNK